MNLNERKANTCGATFADGKIYINLGAGDHSCDKWEITKRQADLLLVDLAREMIIKRLYLEKPK